MLAFLSGLFTSFSDVLRKKGLEKIDEYVLAWGGSIFGLPLLVLILSFIELPKLSLVFWCTLIGMSSFFVFTVLLYLRALKAADLSTCIPLTAFVPLFTALSSPLLINEIPSKTASIGICCVVVGAYVLNINRVNTGLLEPIKALVFERGPRLMLTVSLLWGISPNFHRIGIKESTPLVWSISLGICGALLWSLVVMVKRKQIRIIASELRLIIPLGIFGALSTICMVFAINYSFVSYAITIRRACIALLSVLFGHLFFKEKNILEKAAAVLIMITGISLISLF